MLFDFGTSSPELDSMLKILSPASYGDAYKIILNIEHIAPRQEISEEISVSLNSNYRSLNNATVVSDMLREMSIDDILWCMKDYPDRAIGKIKSFSPTIVKV